jgi:hypothetical protein
MGTAKVTPNTAENVCNQLAIGSKSLRQICKEQGFTHTAFLLQVRANKELANQYTRAMDIGCDAAFDAFRELANEQPERGEHGVDPGWVNWRRTQIDALKWELAHRNPRKYGERLQVDGNVTISLADSIREARARLVQEDDPPLLEASIDPPQE